MTEALFGQGGCLKEAKWMRYLIVADTSSVEVSANFSETGDLDLVELIGNPAGETHILA